MCAFPLLFELMLLRVIHVCALQDNTCGTSLLVGEGSVTGWGGEFSPLICGTDFQTGCQLFFLQVLRFLPSIFFIDIITEG